MQWSVEYLEYLTSVCWLFSTKMSLVKLPPDLIHRIAEEVMPMYSEGFDYRMHGNSYKHLDPIHWAQKTDDGVWSDGSTPGIEKIERYDNLQKIRLELDRAIVALNSYKEQLTTIDQVSEDREVVKRKYDIWLKIIQQDEYVEVLQNRYTFMRQIFIFRRAMLSHQNARPQVP